MPMDESTASRVRALLGRRRDLREQKIMGGICFMSRGHMCCSASGKGGLLVRVGKNRYAEALREPHVTPMRMGKKTMSGFVRIAPEGYRTAAQLQRWVERGLAFTRDLPLKTAARKRKRTPRKANARV